MNWEQARQLLRLRRPRAPERHLGPTGRLASGTDPLASVRAASVCVASGKGGTGKSLVCASLASLLARRGRTLLVDGDMGVANAHILQDVTPEHSFVDVVEGRREVSEIVVNVGPQLDLLAGGSGFSRMAGLSPYELHLIADGLEKLELGYRTLLVDSAAGISNQTISIAAASDLVLLVTTPDVTAMTDAYAFLKVFLQRKPSSEALLVVNRATDEHEALRTAERIREVSRKFLGRAPRWLGTLPEDRAAFRSTQRRQPVVTSEPQSPLAAALRELGHAVAEELARRHPHGLGRSLVQRVAYSPKLA